MIDFDNISLPLNEKRRENDEIAELKDKVDTWSALAERERDKRRLSDYNHHLALENLAEANAKIERLLSAEQALANRLRSIASELGAKGDWIPSPTEQDTDANDFIDDFGHGLVDGLEGEDA